MYIGWAGVYLGLVGLYFVIDGVYDGALDLVIILCFGSHGKVLTAYLFLL